MISDDFYHEPNYFEDEEVANQWIAAIENKAGWGRTREREIYPFLYDWSSALPVKSTILEIGSGQGVCSSKLNLQNRNYIGVEPSSFLVDRAFRLFNHDNVKFLLGNGYDTKLINNSVDAIFSVGVWFHIKDLNRLHSELSRVIKPGGELLIITGSQLAQKDWESFYKSPKVEGSVIEGEVLVPGGSMKKNILYLHSNDDIIKSLTENNFVVSNIKEIGFGAGNRKYGIFILIQAKYLG